MHLRISLMKYRSEFSTVETRLSGFWSSLGLTSLFYWNCLSGALWWIRTSDGASSLIVGCNHQFPANNNIHQCVDDNVMIWYRRRLAEQWWWRHCDVSTLQRHLLFICGAKLAGCVILFNQLLLGWIDSRKGGCGAKNKGHWLEIAVAIPESTLLQYNWIWNEQGESQSL